MASQKFLLEIEMYLNRMAPAPAVSWCDMKWEVETGKKVKKLVNFTFSLTATVSKLNAHREGMKPLGKFRFQSEYSYYILWRSSSPRRETYPRNLIATCCVFPKSSPAWRSSEHALPFSCTIQQQTKTHSTQTVFDGLLSWMPGKLLLFRLYSMTKQPTHKTYKQPSRSRPIFWL